MGAAHGLDELEVLVLEQQHQLLLHILSIHRLVGEQTCRQACPSAYSSIPSSQIGGGKHTELSGVDPAPFVHKTMRDSHPHL